MQRVLDFLHSNGPGLIYYISSFISLLALCISSIVFTIWKDPTTPVSCFQIDDKVRIEKIADMTGEEYQRLLINAEDAEEEALVS